MEGLSARVLSVGRVKNVIDAFTEPSRRKGRGILKTCYHSEEWHGRISTLLEAKTHECKTMLRHDTSSSRRTLEMTVLEI